MQIQKKSFRLDIQALRATAVSVVLLYHLWPERIPGGYIGVDVFFVISGFLITSHLLKQAEKPTGIQLGKFWAARVRRLLPLACFVLLSTLAMVLVWMPQSTWKPFLRNIIASTIYMQNWLLSSDSVSYLARDQQATPTQHFWSLSVEEQFYVIWPLLILFSTSIALKIYKRKALTHRGLVVRRGVLISLFLVFFTSFTYSFVLTTTSPELAYFATTTRAWEFAVGGLLSYLGTGNIKKFRKSTLVFQVSASWIGFLIIIVTSLALPVGTPFPGTAALLPVGGAALFIWAGKTKNFFSTTLLSKIRPLTYLGDISYGVYLWHWPLIVIVPFIFSANTTFQKLVILVFTLCLAALSKFLIEDPFRFGTFWKAKIWRSFILSAVAMALVSVLSVGAIALIDNNKPANISLPPLSSEVSPSTTDVNKPLVPSVANRGEDREGMYDCFHFDSTGPGICSYGSLDSRISIAIVGDSHAAQFIPALKKISEQNKWKLTTYVGLNCDAMLTPPNCQNGPQAIENIVSSHFNIVLVASFRASSYPDGSVEKLLTELVQRGAPLLPLLDTPYNPKATFDCLDASGGVTSKALACTTSRDIALGSIPDRVAIFSEKLGIRPIDLTNQFCDASVCYSVINNTVVYQDSPSSHLTTTFSELLAPLLDKELKNKLSNSQ